MSWERRQRGGLYYTRTRKVNGRQVREYIGSGPAGELAAALDAQRRAERQARLEQRREERREEEARLEAADATLVGLCGGSDLLARAALLAAGFREHRGEWRRARHGPDHEGHGEDG